jgi:zinc transport system permease protein
MPTEWLDQIMTAFSRQFPQGHILSYLFMIKALLAVILVSLICGGVGSLVVGNRMAFFSDALAHTAFAGVGLALLIGVLMDAPKAFFHNYSITVIMSAFGIFIGLCIAFVREQTGLASDTVIGVFFAGAVGFGSVLLSALGHIGYFNVEQFLFGDPLGVTTTDLFVLSGLLVFTLVILFLMSNGLLFSSFNPSLAKSRNIPVRLGDYVFIALLGVIVNLCLKMVGALLINALLIVPAATAANLSRNMRQMYWLTIALTLFSGIGGVILSFELEPVTGLKLGTSGCIVVLSVLLFFVSVGVQQRIRARGTRRDASTPVPVAVEAKT